MPGDRSASLTVERGEIVAVVAGRRHRLPVSEILEIAAYKYDEITTDLICFDVRSSNGTVWTFHEDMAGFGDLIAAFERLPGFDANWRDRVVLPAFERNWTLVWVRSV
jgi:hypothetical protein